MLHHSQVTDQIFSLLTLGMFLEMAPSQITFNFPFTVFMIVPQTTRPLCIIFPSRAVQIFTLKNNIFKRNYQFEKEKNIKSVS